MPTLLTNLKSKKIEDIQQVVNKALKAGLTSEIAGFDLSTGNFYAYKRSECLNNTKIKTIVKIVAAAEKANQQKQSQFKKPLKSKQFFTFSEIFQALSLNATKKVEKAKSTYIPKASSSELANLRNEFASLSLA